MAPLRQAAKHHFDSYSEHIAIVKPDAIGDFVLLSGVLKEIRRMRPHDRIALFVNHAIYDYAARCPYVNSVHPIFKSDKRSFQAVMAAADKFLRENNDQVFDRVILARWDVDYYFASQFCARLPALHRYAYSERNTIAKSIANKGFDSLFTEVLLDQAIDHESAKNSKLFEWALGHSFDPTRPVSWTTMADEIWYQELKKSIQESLRNNPEIIIAPEASEAQRMLSPAKWNDVINQLKSILSHLNPIIYILGTVSSRELSRYISNQISGSVDLTGRTTISNAIKLLSNARLLLAMDSGIAHLAASFYTPSVIFLACTEAVNPASPRSTIRFGPMNPNVYHMYANHLAAPCDNGQCSQAYSHCINEFSLSELSITLRNISATINASH